MLTTILLAFSFATFVFVPLRPFGGRQRAAEKKP
jgi:hypothetical protein